MKEEDSSSKQMVLKVSKVQGNENESGLEDDIICKNKAVQS